MRSKKAIVSALCLAGLLVPATAAKAADEPAWLLSVTGLPTNFPPGAQGEVFGGPDYLVVATNVGAAPSSGPITVTSTLPTGLSLTSGAPSTCAAIAQTVTCTFKDEKEPGDNLLEVDPGRNLQFRLPVDVSPLAPPSLQNETTIEGGGAAPASASTTNAVSSTAAPFSVLPGFRVPLSEADGTAATLAGSHPYQLTAVLGFPTEKKPSGDPPGLGAAGHLHDASVDFPPGLTVNPAATPVLCTEAELTSQGLPGCPDASQVGIVDITTITGGPFTKPAPLYNMVPPPGTAASLGLDAFGVGIFVHLDGEVRSEGDYGISGGTRDALAYPANPVFGAQVQLWGDPSAKSHDEARGACLTGGKTDCPVTAQEIALLSTPVHCSGEPETSEGRADSWEAPGLFEKASYASAALDGTPVSLTGCNQLEFAPAIEARPTTNLTDSPSGLDFSLTQPQGAKLDEPVPSVLKDITLTLPEGLVVNPAAADGQEACSTTQIGLTTAIGATPIHFTKDPPECPNASKLGTVEVTTPLLAQLDLDTREVLRDSEGNAIPRPLPGSVYLAAPFDNPFGTLLATYLVVEDELSGTVAKLAVRVTADPVTGQLSTQLKDAPQLPLQKASLHLFEGARASLRTPPACATHTSEAALVPWAAPEIPNASESDSFATTATPDGGPCPTQAAAAPHRPGFVAGTLAPVAGAFSPLAMKLTRSDASQPLAGFEATLPPGLSARLAGVPYCSEAQIAQARSREDPKEGALEQAAPSCPASAEIGTLTVGAGAGPTPLHIGGRLYLAGPYKGAPLSVVAITPAVVGPFDLGAVVVRSAVYLDPTTAQGRAVSDPLPTILEGIPTDVRSLALRIARPQFTLNPTSCEPLAVTGLATSAFGQGASLTSPFQVGGCDALPYKPKLSARLFGPTNRGGHPRLRAILTAKPGHANTARTVLTLPRSEFIDQAHFRTICTRVQYAANQCPAGSIYGYVKAMSPLLDYPVQGPVFLRSSSQELPDVVFALRGPSQQPLAFDAVGHNDSVNGRLRITFPTIPDAPLSKVIVTMQGAAKGLFQNSTNICKGAHRATLKMVAHNGKVLEAKPLFKAQCGKKAGKKGKGKGRGR